MAKKDIVYTGEAAKLNDEVIALQKQLDEAVKKRDEAYKVQLEAENAKKKDAKDALSKAMSSNDISADDVLAFIAAKKGHSAD